MLCTGLPGCPNTFEIERVIYYLIRDPTNTPQKPSKLQRPEKQPPMSGRKEKESAPGVKRQVGEQRENISWAVVCVNSLDLVRFS